MYERDVNDVIGVIRAKDLIFVKPEVSLEHKHLLPFDSYFKHLLSK